MLSQLGVFLVRLAWVDLVALGILVSLTGYDWLIAMIADHRARRRAIEELIGVVARPSARWRVEPRPMEPRPVYAARSDRMAPPRT